MLRQPDGSLVRSDWDTALDRVATGFQDIVEKHGPNAVALYLSGQLLTEDYYVANKLMKGFIGSANVDTNSRLCMASSVAGHRWWITDFLRRMLPTGQPLSELPAIALESYMQV